MKADMKYCSRIALVVCALFTCSIMYGCGSDPVPSEEIQDTTVSTEETTSVETTEEQTTAEETEPTTETTSKYKDDGIDYIKLLESTTICGKQLSYPVTWGQFGDDFTVVSEDSSVYESGRILAADVKYKGHSLGSFAFDDCISISDINEETPIGLIYIYDNEIDSFDIPKIEVNGIGFGATHDQLFNALDNHYHEGVNYSQIVSNGAEGKYIFDFDYDEDVLRSINIKTYK